MTSSLARDGAERRPVFVLGMPRSGTTLMAAMLSAHEHIVIIPESHFLDEGMDRHYACDLSDPKAFQNFWANYTDTGFFQSHGFDATDLARRIHQSETITWRDVYAHILDAYASRANKSRVGDKSHLDYPYVQLLLDWFPDARIIVMVRDPRAVVSSLLQVPWTHSVAYIHALQWREGYAIMERCIGDPRVRSVQYEQLVSEPEASLRTVCDFLGEAYDSRMLERGEDPTPMQDVKGWELNAWWAEHRRKAGEAITRARLTRWQEELSPAEIAIVEHLCRAQLNAMRLECTTVSLSLSHRSVWCVQRLRFWSGRVRRVLTDPSRLWRKIYRPEGQRLLRRDGL